MAMGHTSRMEYLSKHFPAVEGGKHIETGTMFPGDVIFFHTAHIHKAPPPGRSTRKGPRRTYFFGFDSDQKTCETEFIRASDFKPHWGEFNGRGEGGSHQTLQIKRKQIRSEAFQQIKAARSKRLKLKQK